MKTDYAKVAVLGFKILAAVVGGVALFAGLSKMVGKSNSQPEEDNDEQPDEGQCLTEEEWNERPPRRYGNGGPNLSETGNKIINGIRVGQAALAGTMNIVTGVAAVASNINRIFDPNYYKNMLDDPMASTGFFGTQMIPSYAAGDYPWNRQVDPGLPYNTPIYRGKEPSGEDIWWLRRQNNVIEVW